MLGERWEELVFCSIIVAGFAIGGLFEIVPAFEGIPLWLAAASWRG